MGPIATRPLGSEGLSKPSVARKASALRRQFALLLPVVAAQDVCLLASVAWDVLQREQTFDDLQHPALVSSESTITATGNNIYLVTLLFLAIQGGWLDVQYFYFGLYLSTRL